MYTVLSVFCFSVNSIFCKVKVVYCFEAHNLDSDFSSLRTNYYALILCPKQSTRLYVILLCMVRSIFELKSEIKPGTRKEFFHFLHWRVTFENNSLKVFYLWVKK